MAVVSAGQATEERQLVMLTTRRNKEGYFADHHETGKGVRSPFASYGPYPSSRVMAEEIAKKFPGAVIRYGSAMDEYDR